MAGASYEVEIKTLLGAPERAEQLRKDLHALDPSCTKISSYAQLNHYFEGGNPQELAERLGKYLSKEAQEKMQKIAAGEKISIRSRSMSGKTFIVMKASVGSDSSANGVARLELEEPVALSLDELDKEMLGAGYHYQAKWSREREEYKLGDMSVCLDKNAGYGYLAEFEKVIGQESEVAAARGQIEGVMAKLGLVELPQDRLERMFAFYNSHWPEYYGTDKIFIIE